ncbi:hypothetical protein BO94DRAFT_363789 [Aspergillus sclerotioniger CBS 115572]|uniref:Uncharacterized protein n=1 Tax=Aspergillus sclerotioniger CBS 115572 TaxID=1450535 RepID=A0A317X4V4_9EURO|nr:hypothetical protein BO94DRAFT_363789 [Aspergillus sclerotioniger CBS 115572]PWY93231.1 hypothetical protein BO94DRAFT_363789 [Aspergillus sclerotioniger CBS 115572]
MNSVRFTWCERKLYKAYASSQLIANSHFWRRRNTVPDYSLGYIILDMSTVSVKPPLTPPPSIPPQLTIQHPCSSLRECTTFHLLPESWKRLERIDLTKSALQKLCKRILRRRSSSRHRWPFQHAPDFLRSCTPSSIKHIKKFFRQGGPDLSDIRNVC